MAVIIVVVVVIVMVVIVVLAAVVVAFVKSLPTLNKANTETSRHLCFGCVVERSI